MTSERVGRAFGHAHRSRDDGTGSIAFHACCFVYSWVIVVYLAVLGDAAGYVSELKESGKVSSAELRENTYARGANSSAGRAPPLQEAPSGRAPFFLLLVVLVYSWVVVGCVGALGVRHGVCGATKNSKLPDRLVGSSTDRVDLGRLQIAR